MKSCIVILVTLILLSSCSSGVQDNVEVDIIDDKYLSLEVANDELSENYSEKLNRITELEKIVEELENRNLELESALIDYENNIEFLYEELRKTNGNLVFSSDRSVIAYIIDNRATTDEYIVEIRDGNSLTKSVYEVYQLLPFERELKQDENASFIGFSLDDECIYGVIGDGASVSAPFYINLISGDAKGFVDDNELKEIKEKHPY